MAEFYLPAFTSVYLARYQSFAHDRLPDLRAWQTVLAAAKVQYEAPANQGMWIEQKSPRSERTMADNTQWEYRIRTFGTMFRGMKYEELEAILNEWGTEGWEVINARGIENTNKVTILAKRPLTASIRRRRTLPV